MEHVDGICSLSVAGQRVISPLRGACDCYLVLGIVPCDHECGALSGEPKTKAEIVKALTHWRDHSCRGGCAHGRS